MKQKTGLAVAGGGDRDTAVVVRLAAQHTEPAEVRFVRGDVLRRVEVLHQVRARVLLLHIRVRVHFSCSPAKSGGVFVVECFCLFFYFAKYIICKFSYFYLLL